MAALLFVVVTPVFAHDMDAAFFNPNTKAYFFAFDGVYIIKGFGQDLGNSVPLNEFGGNYPNSWSDGIDSAVFNSDTGRYYFFKYIEALGEWQYIAKAAEDGQNFTAPASINQFAANDFPAQCAAHAAVYDPIDKIYYFFNENGTFCSKDLGAEALFQVRSGDFANNFPPAFLLKAAALRTGVDGSADRYFFFSNDDFIRMDYEVDAFSSILDTRSAWGGWPAKHGETVPPLQPLDLTVPDVVFTDPITITKKLSSSKVITDRLIEMINAADGEVFLGVYLLDDDRVDEALINAHERGVDVWVITDDDAKVKVEDKTEDPSCLDSWEGTPTYTNRDRNEDLHGKVDFLHFVKTCGFIHNKVALFSSLQTTGGVLTDVIFSSSANYTSAAINKYQDALTVSDAEMFAGFREQVTRIIDDNKDYIVSIPGAADGMRAYFFPRDSGVDTVEDILQNLREKTTYGPLEHMAVKINMGSWTDSRLGILDELGNIANLPNGSVHIIATGSKTNVEADEIKIGIGSGNVKYNFLGAWCNWNAHSKYMLVDVGYRNETTSQLTEMQIVYAGSENFTGNALTKHFESWIKIIKPDIYTAYEANFDIIWELTTPIFRNGLEEGCL